MKNNLCTNKVNLFKYLSYEDQVKLNMSMTPVKISSGETLIFEGDEANIIYVLDKGKIKLNKFDDNGKEIILSIINPGDTIGEDSFFEKDNFDYNAEAIENSTLCKISKDSLYKILENDPNFTFQIVDHLSDKIKSLNERVQLLMENDALKRVVIFLLETNNSSVDLNIDDIAGSINIRRETVSRKLSELNKLGLIERTGQKSISIKDRNKLLEFYFQSNK